MDSETIFAVLVGIALACFGLAMVGYSFFRHREPEDSAIPLRSESDSAGVGLEALLDSVDTLELEHQLGNIPGEQYLQQLQSYRLQIAVLVRDQLESGARLPGNGAGAGGPAGPVPDERVVALLPPLRRAVARDVGGIR